jgi:hypothetical protein
MASFTEGRSPDLVAERIETEDLLGYIEVCTPSEIGGWVVHKKDLRRALTVSVACREGSHDVPVATYRRELEDAGMGNGAAGFKVLLANVTSRAIWGVSTPARFMIRHDNEILYRRDFSIHPDLARAGSYRWAIDVKQPLRVVGWIIDQLKDESVWIEIENPSTRLVATALADGMRPDLADVFGRAKAKAAFEIKLPLKLRMDATSFDLFALDGDRRVFLGRFDLPPIVGFLDDAGKNGFVEGWTINMRDSALRPLVEVLVDGQVVSSAHATIYRSDLKKVTGGDGFFGFRLPTPRAAQGAIVVRASLPEGEAMLL